MLTSKPYLIHLDKGELDYVLAKLVFYYRQINPEYLRFEKNGLTFWKASEIEAGAQIDEDFCNDSIDVLNQHYFKVRKLVFGLRAYFNYRKQIWGITDKCLSWVVIFSPNVLKVLPKDYIMTMKLEDYVVIESSKSFIFNQERILDFDFYCPAYSRYFRVIGKNGLSEKVNTLVEKVKEIYPEIIEKEEFNGRNTVIVVSNGGKEYTFVDPIVTWYCHKGHFNHSPLVHLFDDEEGFLDDLRSEKQRWGF